MCLTENITTAIFNQAIVTWLLLLHQVPPSPPYLRAKVLRRLKQVGALPLKKSAYLLPNTEDALEDFQWILNEIRSDGGEAWILRADAVAGLTDESIRESFRELRAAEYQELLAEVSGNLGNPPKLRKRYQEIVKIDFFDAPGKQEVLEAMKGTRVAEFSGRRWVTRRGIKVDRSACCWLIRRFIDASANIEFVNPDEYQHRAGEVRFDMFEGEITHEVDLCSFEVLARSCGLEQPRLRAIAEMVHDLDLKDGKFGRPETAGVAAMLAGIAARHESDQKRMEEAMVLFDALYAQSG
jgi:hypothetical protein